ncbi:MAG: SpoIIE family protein phosphatase [Hyphomicrobiales bacterium]
MAKRFEHGLMVRPFLGERVAGDAGLVLEENDGLFLAIIDVLGHGPEAHEVARHIIGRLEREDRSELCELLSRLHESVIGTRGAAIAVARLNFENGLLQYAGIGNTVCRKIGREPVRLVSRDGTLGHIMRTPRLESLQMSAGDILLLYTDGVQDHFDLEEYSDLETDSAWSLARTIIRQFGKPHDDATCIAVRMHHD